MIGGENFCLFSTVGSIGRDQCSAAKFCRDGGRRADGEDAEKGCLLSALFLQRRQVPKGVEWRRRHRHKHQGVAVETARAQHTVTTSRQGTPCVDLGPAGVCGRRGAVSCTRPSMDAFELLSIGAQSPLHEAKMGLFISSATRPRQRRGVQSTSSRNEGCVCQASGCGCRSTGLDQPAGWVSTTTANRGPAPSATQRCVSLVRCCRFSAGLTFLSWNKHLDESVTHQQGNEQSLQR